MLASSAQRASQARLDFLEGSKEEWAGRRHSHQQGLPLTKGFIDRDFQRCSLLITQDTSSPPQPATHGHVWYVLDIFWNVSLRYQTYLDFFHQGWTYWCTSLSVEPQLLLHLSTGDSVISSLLLTREEAPVHAAESSWNSASLHELFKASSSLSTWTCEAHIIFLGYNISEFFYHVLDRKVYSILFQGQETFASLSEFCLIEMYWKLKSTSGLFFFSLNPGRY